MCVLMCLRYFVCLCRHVCLCAGVCPSVCACVFLWLLLERYGVYDRQTDRERACVFYLC